MNEGSLNKTTRAYNFNADKYHAKFSVNEEYRKQIKMFSEILPPSSRVLDMGCGTGVNAGLLSEDGHKVTGIDSSSGMLEIASKHCSSANFEECSVLNYRPSEKFDAIVLSFMIVHLINDDADILLSRLPDFLCRPGFLYISYMTGKISGFETTSFSKNEIFFNYFERKLIEEKLIGSGFQLQKSDSAPYQETDGTHTEDVFQVYTIS